MIRNLVVDNRDKNLISKDFRDYLLKIEAVKYLKNINEIDDNEYEEMVYEIKKAYNHKCAN